MKYIVLLGDGMSDWPIDELGGKTPLEVANKPNMDKLIKHSVYGLANTIPEGMPAGSDVANLSVFSFDPKKYYTGRSPLEAVSMGIKLSSEDTALRCNLVTLSDTPNYQDSIMLDYSSGEISTEESILLINSIKEQLDSELIAFHSGISYRHCMVWGNGPMEIELTPPHDISGKSITDFLPKGPGAELALELMEKSTAILKNHPVNKKRIEKGLNPATSIWLWGQGKRPEIPLFVEKYGLCGSVISAVDLIKGIGIASGMNPVNVKGATGNMNTNFKGKAEAALNELAQGRDFVYIHVEAPDECGHQGQLKDKIHAIELIDKMVLAPLIDGLDGKEDYRIIILPDHPTPIATKTHSNDPVPFFIYDSRKPELLDSQAVYTEAFVKNGLMVNEGYKLMDILLESDLK